MPEPEKKKYKKNFLSQIIYQLTFDKLSNIDNDSVKSLHAKIKDSYTELATVEQQGIIIQGDGSTIHTEQENSFIWQTESKDKSHIVVIAPDSLAVTFTKYVNFREFEPIIRNVTEAFIDTFSSVQNINRLGLRYVNQIKPVLPMTKWSDYLSSKLTDSLDFVDSENLRRSMHSIVVMHDEETCLNINYGIYNQYFPAPIVDKEFILDIDAYSPSQVSSDDISKLLEKFNKTIAIYFELSIKDKLREEMEVIDEK